VHGHQHCTELPPRGIFRPFAFFSRYPYPSAHDESARDAQTFIDIPQRMIGGTALLLVTLVLRSLCVGHRVRVRLLTSCVVFATSAVAAALAKYAPLSPAVVDEIRTVTPLSVIG
jgi:hypothetical protein